MYAHSLPFLGTMHSHVSVKISMSHCLCMHTLLVSCIHMSVLRYPCLTVCVCTLSPFPWYHAFTCQCKISMSHCLCMHTLSLSLVPCIHMSVLRYPCLTVCVCTLSPFPWYHAFTCQCKISMSHCLCMHTLLVSCIHMSVLRYPCLTVYVCTLSWYHAFTCQC